MKLYVQFRNGKSFGRFCWVALSADPSNPGRKPRRDVPSPNFAVYLLGRDPAPGPWPHRWVRWRDFRLPDSTEDATAALCEAWERAGEERVEIACGGGIGRTGTALALLATMSGVAPEDAVAWVRAHYHRRAVESRRQRHWVEATAESLRSGRA